MSITDMGSAPRESPPIETPECQTPVVDQAPFGSDDTHRDEKIRVCKTVASAPEGLFLTALLKRIYPDDPPESGSAGYQRVRRFVNSNPQFFRVQKVSGQVMVSPQLALFDLINGGIIQDRRERPQNADSRFCRKMLGSIKEVNAKGQRLLSGNLREYIERISDLRLILHSESVEPEYLTLPYKTRFNDLGRVRKQFSVFSGGLELAGENNSNAVMLTLTTDPKKFDSIADMWDNINKSWNRFMSWIAGDSHLGRRPEYVKILEATEAGYPHIHALVFLKDHETRADGMPYLEDKNAISNYWNKYQGQIVDAQPLTWMSDLPEEYDQEEGWVRWRKDGDHGGSIEGDREGAQTAGQYLGKYLSAIYDGIRGMNTDDMAEPPETTADLETGEKEREKAALWKIAMYWATNRRIRSMSRDLRQRVEADHEEETEEDQVPVADLISAGEYKFEGAYPVNQIPGHIRRESAPVDAIMSDVTVEEDRSGHVVGPPAPSPVVTLADRLEGAGLLDRALDPPPDPVDLPGGADPDHSPADFM